MNILHIDASASDLATSHTRRLSKELVERLKATKPDATVTYRDLVADQLPHVDMTIRHAWMPEHGDDPKLAETMNRSKVLVDELKAADVVVIGAPMYNFTVPSTLKAWIDHVSIAGQTFSYTAEGPRGLVSGKVHLVLSSGGIYSQGPFAANDHLSTWKRSSAFLAWRRSRWSGQRASPTDRSRIRLRCKAPAKRSPRSPQRPKQVVGRT
jgi:FMN-dependent NADH-azoreductase